MKTQNKEHKITRGKLVLANLVMGLIGALASTGMASAWGPTRSTFTMETPATYVTFNSITNNPTVGDERNFVRVREAGTENTYVDTLEIEPGKEYEVWIMYHNNAASNYNASGKGIANGVKAMSSFPSKVTPSEKGQINGVIQATDANPAKVWDEAYLTTKADEVFLRYVPGSAKIHNAGKVNDTVLSDTLFTSDGVYLGINVLDGRIPGCAEYSGYIKYTIRAENVAARVDKTASVDGESFRKSIVARPGDTVTYQVSFTNTGTRDLTNVTFHDVLPEGMELVPGSTYLYDIAHADGQNLTDDLIDKNGYNTGLYSKGTTAKVVYKVKIKDDAELCNKTLVNRMYVDHDAGEIFDGAEVTVNCSDPEEPTPEDCATSTDEAYIKEHCSDPTELPDPDPSKPSDPNSPATPVTDEPNIDVPSELPATGPTEVALTVVVVVGLWIAGAYYVASQKELNKIRKKL